VATPAIPMAHHPLWEYVGTSERPDRGIGARHWARDCIEAFSLKQLGARIFIHLITTLILAAQLLKPIPMPRRGV
jgi:hypothetical protein